MDVLTNGISTSVTIDGIADGPVVTLSHSLATNLSMWDPQIPALAGTHRIIRYSSRGHGTTEAPTGAYDFDVMAEDAAAMLRSLGIRKTHFIGLSMGGMVGMGLATRHPDLIESLILCDTMSEVTDAYRAVCDERIRIALTHGMEAVIESTINRWFTPPFVAKRPAILDAVREMIRTTPVNGYVGGCLALKKLDYTPRLRAIAAPTLILVGRDDPTTTVDAARLMHAHIAGSRLVIIESASHLSNIERPDQVNQAIGEFLNRQVRRRP